MAIQNLGTAGRYRDVKRMSFVLAALGYRMIPCNIFLWFSIRLSVEMVPTFGREKQQSLGLQVGL